VPVGEQPQHHRRVLDHHRAQPRVTQRRDRSRQGIVGVVLRPAPRTQEVDLGRQPRRNVDHVLPGPDQLLGQQEHQPARGLDGPGPFGERRGERQQLTDLAAARADRQPGQLTLITVD
jgi:hypothetical protein